MLIFLFIFFIFENYFQQIFSEVKYFDELLTFVSFYFIIKYNKYGQYVNKESKLSVFCIKVIFIIGFLSTIIYNIQPEFSGVWRDALAIIKFPVCYYAFYLYSKTVDAERLLKQLLPWAKFFVSIICILGIATLLFRIPLFYSSERYGLPLFDLAFSHSTFLVAILFVLIATLISSGFKRNIIYITMGAIAVLLTLRSKPMVPLVFLCIVWLIRLRKQKIKLTKGRLVLYSSLIIVLSYFAAYSQITEYIEYGIYSARGACYYSGVDIANTYFPLGSGFCTFASSLSGIYYSPLYYYYNLDYIQGLKPDDFSYAADSFWPNIFSQYGWIGFIIYLFMLFYIIKSIHKRFIVLSDKWIAGMMLMLYTLSAAFAETIYTNDTSVIYAITLNLFLGNDETKR